MTEAQRIERILRRWNLEAVGLARKPEHGGTGRLRFTSSVAWWRIPMWRTRWNGCMPAHIRSR